jgi:hypothetical protein
MKKSEGSIAGLINLAPFKKRLQAAHRHTAVVQAEVDAIRHEARHTADPHKRAALYAKAADMQIYLRKAKAEELARKRDLTAAEKINKKRSSTRSALQSKETALADEIISLRDQIKGMSASGDPGTIEGLMAQLQSVAQSMNDAFQGENGNVFGRIVVQGGLNQHFAQQPDPDHWHQATLFRLANVGG